MSYHGDIALESTIDIKFATVGTTGAPTTLAGTPVVSAYFDNDTGQLTAGITLSVDFDGVTGLNNVRVAATAANDYAAGKNYALVITTGTVGGTSVVGYVIGSFSIQNRSGLRPTTAGRTLDVSAGGEAGVDWANVGSPTTTVGLSGTTVKNASDVEVDTQDIQARLPAALTAAGNIKADALAISGDGTAADNCELMFDGTGYAGGTTKLGIDVVNWKGATAPAMTGDAYAVVNGRLPAALTGAGNIKADALAIDGQTTDAAAGVTFPASVGTSTYAGGAVASVTAGVTLAADAVDAAALKADAASEIAVSVWAAANRRVSDATNITSTGGTTVPQTGDSYSRLGAPAGASVSADIADIHADLGLVGGEAGAGSEECILTVKDTDNVVIADAAVWITTEEDPETGVVAGTLYTDNLGKVTFFLDPGDYFSWAQKSGVNFDNPQSFTVT